MKFNTFDTYKVDSNLGGIFTLKFIKFENGRYYFKVTTKGFVHVQTFDKDTVQKVKIYGTEIKN